MRCVKEPVKQPSVRGKVGTSWCNHSVVTALLDWFVVGPHCARCVEEPGKQPPVWGGVGTLWCYRMAVTVPLQPSYGYRAMICCKQTNP